MVWLLVLVLNWTEIAVLHSDSVFQQTHENFELQLQLQSHINN